MAKGRKPNVKEVKAPKAGLAKVFPAATLPEQPLDAATGRGIAMPITVGSLPAAEECWHVIMDGQTRFTMHELPLIESYCLSYAAMRQATANMTASADGTMSLVVGEPGTMPKKNPSWAVFNEAVANMRSLSGVLGLDTLTAERLNLTKATTASIAADLPAKIRKAAREALSDG